MAGPDPFAVVAYVATTKHQAASLNVTEVIAIAGFALALASLGWQFFVWWWGHAFDVQVSVEDKGVFPASRRYEIIVIVRNLGRTDEAVGEVILLYAEHEAMGVDFSTRVAVGKELPPNREVRQPIDLLGGRFQTVFPSELTAIVALESGRLVRSAPFRPTREHLMIALGKDP